jgi:hypothetical protein
MRRLLVALGMVLAVAMGASGVASAGGWVVISLDSTPVFRAGVPTEIGFRVLRHGVNLENPEINGAQMNVVLTAPDGTQTRFDVEPSGAVGHHVATVTVPEAGTYDWRVTGPSFMDAELGSIVVEPASGGTRGSDSSAVWPILQWGTAGLAVAMAALVAIDLMRSRRLAAA